MLALAVWKRDLQHDVSTVGPPRRDGQRGVSRGKRRAEAQVPPLDAALDAVPQSGKPLRPCLGCLQPLESGWNLRDAFRTAVHVSEVIRMATRTPVEVVPTSYSYVFSPYREPIARVTQGQRVVVHCDDAFESRIRSRDDVPSLAPAFMERLSFLFARGSLLPKLLRLPLPSQRPCFI